MKKKLTQFLGQENIAKKLIQNEADINYHNGDQMTALHYAVKEGKL